MTLFRFQSRFFAVILGLVAAGWLCSSLVLAPVAAAAGHETGNGGNVIRLADGKTYELADLRFEVSETGLFRPSGVLRGELLRLWSHLIHALGLTLSSPKGRNLFSSEILSPHVDFRFVSEFPSDCRFLEHSSVALENAEKLLNAGCTLQGVTFLDAQVFGKLSTAQKALLLLHERLHAFAPEMALSHKMQIVRAISILESRYFPALEAMKADPALAERFEFTPSELATLNLLSFRLRQLTGRTSADQTATDIVFTRHGGLLRSFDVPGQDFEDWTLRSEGVMISLGSTITVRSQKSPRKAAIIGKNLRIIRSTLDFESAPNILGVNASIIDSTAHFPAAWADQPWTRALTIRLRNQIVQGWNGPF
jgi:hypothetical protein